MSLDLEKYSIVQWFPEEDPHRCGYCKTSTGNISIGMMIETLTVEEYQDLIDRGWRRSGKYCYKPSMDKTCCPQYTIKCDATNFSVSKSQKKVMRKVKQFLNDGIINKSDMPHEGLPSDAQSDFIVCRKEPNVKINLNKIKQPNNEFENLDVAMSMGEPHNNSDVLRHKVKQDTVQNQSPALEQLTSQQEPQKHAAKKPAGADLSRPPCKKAKLLRLERKKEKLKQKGIEFQVEKPKPNNVQKTLEEFLEDIPATSKHKLKLTLIPTSVPSDQWELVKDIEFELYTKYQTIVHNDHPSKLSMSSFTRFLVTSPLKIILVQMDGDHETFNVSAKLYKKYQLVIHNDTPLECSETEFHTFLVDTPLKPKKFPDGVDGLGYGSFHQQYWIDDKLIAVGVIDILPKCVSSVYFFYDPDYRDLTLGTYGSLREISLTRSLQSQLPDLKNYYMGFYIHSCPKMRYKGRLVPSYLLCPETYVWVPIERCLEKLEKSKYSRLNEDSTAVDENICSEEQLLNMKVIYCYRLMYSRDYIRLCEDEESARAICRNIGTLVGKKCAQKLLFFIVD